MRTIMPRAAYDGFDRLATTTYPLGSTEVLTYDADSNVLTRKTRAGDTISFAYDTLNRLTTKTPPSPAAMVSYRYDLAGRLTSLSDTSTAVAAAVPPSGTMVQYATTAAYDALNRPTGIVWTPAPTTATPSASSVTFGHAYNKANQRIGQSATDNSWLNYPAAASPVSYTSDALNRYTAVGAVTPTYDGNSNLTFDGTFTFGYDAENRLTSASGAGNTASYAYDAQGGRKSKTVNGTTTVFVTDAANREVLEYDGASGAILRWYAYGLGPNDVLNQMNIAASTRATLIPDIQGSVIAWLDAGSGALSKIGYLPYGKSAATTPFAFTGQRIDPETNGLYYYRARHYFPAWGRFLQPDPIGYTGGSNLYAYVGNDPTNNTDPSGNILNFVFGGLLNVGIGYAINTAITGSFSSYTFQQAAVDFGIGVATSGLGAIAQARNISAAVKAFRAEGTIVGNAQVSSLFHAERIEYEAVAALQNGADRVFLDRSIGVSTGAGPATGLLARRPDLIIEESGVFSAVEVASKAQSGIFVARRAEQGLQAALGYGEAQGIESIGFTLPWSFGGVRTVGASSLPPAYGLGTAGALDVGVGATTSSAAK